jgi:hypothetical protein
VSIVSVTDPGFESPLRVVFQVTATGSTDAADQAKREAREAGYRIKTLGWIDLVNKVPGPDFDARRDEADWLVMLCVRAVAP